MHTKYIIIILLSCSFLFCACQSSPGVHQKRKPPTADSMILINKNMVIEETTLINNYLNRHKIQADTGPGGVRFSIYKHGNGAQIRPLDKVRFKYEMRFLTGDLVYSSKEDGEREAVLGKTQLETGLYYAFLYMKVGDHAKIVLPSHLAFGAGGDGKKIPPRTTLVYDIEIIDIIQ